MKTKSIIFLLFIFSVLSSNGQKYLTKTGTIKFYSETPIEKIEAHNRVVNAALDGNTGDFVFKVLMKSFEFEKALMQEHFNENYVESDQFPNATFLGKILNIKDVNLEKEGDYPVLVEGKLTIHGVTNSIKEKGTFSVKQGKINAKAKFNILLSDYKVTIPGAVGNNISKTIEITVETNLDKAMK